MKIQKSTLLRKVLLMLLLSRLLLLFSGCDPESIQSNEDEALGAAVLIGGLLEQEDSSTPADSRPEGQLSPRTETADAPLNPAEPLSGQMVTFKLGNAGDSSQITLKADAAQVTAVFDDNGAEIGKKIEGLLFGDSLSGPYKIADGTFLLLEKIGLVESGETGFAEAFASFSGSGYAEIPELGLLNNVNMIKTPLADFGVKPCNQFDTPLVSSSLCIYFKTKSQLDTLISNANIEAPAGTTVVLDPREPAFYLQANFSGISALTFVSDVGLGVSIAGNLQYTPWVPMDVNGLNPEDYEFTGHMYIGGEVDFTSLGAPLTLSGNLVVDMDPDGDGMTNVFDGGDYVPDDFDFKMGSNGRLKLKLKELSGDAAGILKVNDLTLSNASMITRFTEDDKDLTFGLRTPDLVQQLFGSNDLLSGSDLIKNSGTESYLYGYIPLENQGQGWWLLSRTDLKVAGADLYDAELKIDQTGVSLKSEMTLGDWNFSLMGRITAAGFYLEGKDVYKYDDDFFGIHSRVTTTLSIGPDGMRLKTEGYYCDLVMCHNRNFEFSANGEEICVYSALPGFMNGCYSTAL